MLCLFNFDESSILRRFRCTIAPFCRFLHFASGSSLYPNEFGHFPSVWAWESPKRSEISKVVQSTFRYRDFLIIFRESAENRFPGKFRKFKYCILTPFMIVFVERKVTDSELLGFRSFGITGWPEFSKYPVKI